MHQSALAISELYNRFQALTIEQANAERQTFNDRYSEALKLIPVDHKDIDYKRFMIRSSDDLGITGSRYALLLFEYGLRLFWEFSLLPCTYSAPPTRACGLSSGTLRINLPKCPLGRSERVGQSEAILGDSMSDRFVRRSHFATALLI